MVGSIQSLQNMEYMLYGNSPSFGSLGVPSMANGYCAASSYMNSYPYYNAYNNYLFNPSQSIFNNQNMQNAEVLNRDVDKIANFYNEKAQPSQSMVGAALGGAVFGAANHPRLIVHPWNSVKSLGKTEAIFKGIKESGAMNKLWNENNALMREAYFRLHKVESRNLSKLGLFRESYIKNPKDYEALKPVIEELKHAMSIGDADGVAAATAKLKVGYTNNGPLSKFGGYVKRLFGGKTKPNTVEEALADGDAIKAAKAEILANNGNVTFKDALKRGGGIKGGLLMMGMEFFMSRDNIKTAFAYDRENKQKGVDTNYGTKQLGQTLVKGLGNAVGWAVGDAVGVWASAKICASIGTAVAPGVGTLIGGVLGLVGGSIGCWLTGKLTKWMVGQDVGEKIKTEKMKQTPEGQVQLLQLTAQQKDIPADVQQSMQNLLARYNLAA